MPRRATAMGFCLFNNGRHRRSPCAAPSTAPSGVAIVDWDVHHGNGTQEIFWSDPTVLYCSTHQMPLYPGTGAASETGAGNIVNAPLASRQRQRPSSARPFSARILPALDNSAPDLIIVSAGFDAHHRDPLAAINLTEDGFRLGDRPAAATAAAQFSGNRLVSLLEGGYDLQGLAFRSPPMSGG